MKGSSESVYHLDEQKDKGKDLLSYQTLRG